MPGLPSRYLSIQEAASVLEVWFQINVGDNLPVRLDDEHEQSTICGQLREAINSRSSFFGFPVFRSFFFRCFTLVTGLLCTLIPIPMEQVVLSLSQLN